MTEAYKKAEKLLRKYDKARADLRLAEQELKSALREYSTEQRYGRSKKTNQSSQTIHALGARHPLFARRFGHQPRLFSSGH